MKYIQYETVDFVTNNLMSGVFSNFGRSVNVPTFRFQITALRCLWFLEFFCVIDFRSIFNALTINVFGPERRLLTWISNCSSKYPSQATSNAITEVRWSDHSCNPKRTPHQAWSQSMRWPCFFGCKRLWPGSCQAYSPSSFFSNNCYGTATELLLQFECPKQQL